jgi:hypothetical protein
VRAAAQAPIFADFDTASFYKTRYYIFLHAKILLVDSDIWI